MPKLKDSDFKLSDRKIQEHARRLVDKDVLVPQNHTMKLIAKNDECWFDRCENIGLLEDGDEVYEWYAVSDWLSEKLLEKNEVIFDGPDCKIWGRLTTGQAIYIDDVIIRIAREYPLYCTRIL